MENAGGGAEIMPELRDQEGTVVSSTVIRQAIQSGDMTRAISYWASTRVVRRNCSWRRSRKRPWFCDCELENLNEVEPALGVLQELPHFIQNGMDAWSMLG